MKKLQLRDLAVGFVFLVLIAGACKKKVPPPAPPPPPPPAAAAPSVTLAADPTSIQRGQSSTLRWSSQNATDLTIEPAVGAVGPSGTRPVSPNESTTYTITAKGQGGTANASARVTVTAPPPPPRVEPPTPPAPKVSQRDLFDREVRDAFFDFDKADIRPDARDNLTKSAEYLRANPNVNVTIEGHCDERGSVAYNLGLGDRRSNATKDFLVTLGISSERIKTISYGKERPFCTEHDESCWQQNRRGHLVCDNCGS